MGESNETSISTLTADKPNRKPGAPHGNANHLRHGLRSKLLATSFGLSLGTAPAGMAHDWSEARKYQRLLETETKERYGDGAPDIHQAGLVMSASIHSLRCRLARRWLETEAGLTLEQKIALVNLMGNAADARDKVVGKLFEKSSRKDDPWAGVFDAPLPASPQPTTEPDGKAINGSNAADAKPGPLVGIPAKATQRATHHITQTDGHRETDLNNLDDGVGT